MSARLGNPVEIVYTTSFTPLLGNKLNGLTGRYIVFPNQWTMLISMHLEFAASAAAGTRAVTLDFYDISWSRRLLKLPLPGGTATIANFNCVFNVGSGNPQSTLLAPQNLFYIPLPQGMCIPPNANCTIYDGANIDPVNDTFNGSIFYST